MKNIIRRSLLGAMLISLPGMAMAQYQEITVTYEQMEGSRQALVAAYDVSNGELTTGIGFRLHFDSSELEITEIISYHFESNLGIQIMEDTEDLDGNPATDFFINAAWVDLVGQWPASTKLPAALYRVEFETLFPKRKELFDVSVSETAAGFEFVSQTN